MGITILAAAGVGVLQHRETVGSGAASAPERATAAPSVPSPTRPTESEPTESEQGEDAPFSLEQRGKAPENVPDHWSWVHASDGSFRVISGGRPFLEQIPGGWAVDFSIQRGRVAVYVFPTDQVDRPLRYTRQAHRDWREGISGLEDVVVTGLVPMRGAEAWESTGRLGGRTTIMRTLWSDGRLYHLRADFYDQGDARRLADVVLSSFTAR